MLAKGKILSSSYLCYMTIIALKNLMSHYSKLVTVFQAAAYLIFHSMENYSKETSGKGIF